jgi:predicted nuclease of predicted toxin-antitoxin system
MQDASDAEVWGYASETQSILITKDEDLVVPYPGFVQQQIGSDQACCVR